ncbi:rod shape-determining protein [Candidatus Wolfebacteria bacterium RIFCSPHIGHO2_01_FULL_48_22]|uniref:Cell shape-determining protein MreB n=2 Tax=Candidatus Wolfeibacteriota TaxID=1752735 RepID=A0A1F8DTS1_9BACT|nr:MAG: rod shape-determining protein [Candidatus Wolfebacteria bacterium RIFCSPHIGHO2_01_FULL_48_22]OGM92266.1 MAG: rod shape-determining protein [Candidatus Wolfebacteria bacterium RIFCSPLOWO2_01_FULL_47_17b]
MGLFSVKTDIGVDLGTANTLVYAKGEGIVANEPTVIAINTKSGQTVAIGEAAKRMLGRTPVHIEVVRPLVNGVISDFLMAQEVLKHYLQKIKKDSIFKYVRAVVAVPTNLTEVERKSVEDAVISSGASSVYLLEEPIAAVLGAGLPIDEPTANMIVDIGGGTTEIAVISMGGVVVSRSLKIAGDKCNDDIRQYVREEFKLIIGEATSERIKMEIGAAIPSQEKLEMTVAGRDAASGLPKEIMLKDSHVRMALMLSLKHILEAIKDTIEKIPPELSGDVIRNGIHLSGGGSLLRGLDQLIEKELGVKTVLVDDPLTCVVRGCGTAAENIERFEPIFSLSLKPIILE